MANIAKQFYRLNSDFFQQDNILNAIIDGLYVRQNEIFYKLYKL
jgi:hypothetical protein